MVFKIPAPLAYIMAGFILLLGGLGGWQLHAWLHPGTDVSQTTIPGTATASTATPTPVPQNEMPGVSHAAAATIQPKPQVVYLPAPPVTGPGGLRVHEFETAFTQGTFSSWPDHGQISEIYKPIPIIINVATDNKITVATTMQGIDLNITGATVAKKPTQNWHALVGAGWAGGQPQALAGITNQQLGNLGVYGFVQPNGYGGGVVWQPPI